MHLGQKHDKVNIFIVLGEEKQRSFNNMEEEAERSAGNISTSKNSPGSSYHHLMKRVFSNLLNKSIFPANI
jgi:hypothetical protein